jgi:type VI secretion system protein ImpJ
MHLSQHHFQLQSRYFEDATEFAVASLLRAPWGLLACEMDAEALLNGTVALRRARGVMPDGLPFQFPEDPPPEPVEIGEAFSPTRSEHRIMLWVAAYAPDKANTADGEGTGASTRYLPWPRTVVDENTGREETELILARKNFALCLDHQVPEDAVAMPVARVRRDGSGRFVYDGAYIPPSLRIGASEGLLTLLRRLVEMLDQKAGALMAERQAAYTSTAEYAGNEVAGFWLSHAVHSGLAALQHHLQLRAAHPEALFLELSRLAGALCTFSLDAHPRELPSYDHEDLEGCFTALEAHVRRHLEVVLPTNRVAVPLVQTDEPLYTGTVTDPRCFRPNARWYLGIRSKAGTAKLAADVPRLVKVCAARHVMRLVREAFPGMALTHVPSPPSELSPRIGSVYFEIQKDEPCWTTIQDVSEEESEERGRVGAYVPDAVSDPELELVVVLEE